MDYLYDANYKARNINGLVTETRVKDASGNVKAKSQIFYDEVGMYPLLTDVSSTRWEDPNANYRGLVTTTKSWSDISNNLHVTTHAQYDLMGNLRYSWDGRGNLSQVEYSSVYDYAYPTKTISPDPDGSGSTTPFETTIVYDYNTGMPTSTTDANNQTTQTEYNDPLLRPTRAIAANGHQTISEYGAGTSESTRWVKSRSQIDEMNWNEAITWFDGLGRTVRTQSVDDDGDVFVLNCYDNMSRPLKVTNPFRGYTNQDCSTTTGLEWTTNTYDNTGRPWKVTTPDSSIVETAYGLATDGSHIGTSVTVTDQAGKLRRSITNALGQLIRVDEPNASNQLGTVATPNQPTLYTYDTLNNLTTVTQVGSGTEQCGPSGGTCSQTRTFAYNSLSRLMSATNPESGTIGYQYDLNGNLTQKTDARGVQTNYIYDALNRVTQRNYSTPNGLPANYQATPNVAYTYDDASITNSKGKLTKVSSSVSTTEYTAFDILGRVTGHKQTTDGMAYATGYIYNLSGALIEEIYPSGRKVKNVLDNNGDLSQVQSQKNATGIWRPYVSNFVYTAAGAVSSLKLGNGKFENTQFNSRLQPIQIGLGTSAGTQNLLKLDYEYGVLNLGTGQTIAGTNNGNVSKQTITVPTVGANNGFIATQYYAYDSLNRIQIATENVTPNGQSAQLSWRQQFGYDRYGNRNFDEANTTTLPKECSNNTEVCAAIRPVVNPSVNAVNNRLNGYTFDAAGNTIQDAELRKFTYDAENKQAKVETVNSGGTVTGTIGQYSYDGEGKRIKKKGYTNNVLTEATIFVYDAAGKLVAEYSSEIASVNDAKVAYLTNDHLGSPRITTDQSGQVIARHDYHPFGDEIGTLNGGSPHRTTALNYTADNVRQKFTGYERDNETDLDFAQARYYAYNHGRFTSPDPLLSSGRPTNPQTWNRYVYVLNNPLKSIDPSGLWEWSEALGGTNTNKELEKQRDKAKKDKNTAEYDRLNGILTKRQQFVDGLAEAKTEAENLSNKSERNAVKATLAMYGKPMDGNDVTVAQRDSSSGSGVAFTKFENGRVIVAFAGSEFSEASLFVSIAHEGYHMGNIYSDLYQSSLTQEMCGGDTSGFFYTSIRDTEKGAYRVSSLMAQAAGVGSITLNSPNGGTVLWNSSWNAVDSKVLETNRSAAIETQLSNLGLGENDKKGQRVAFPGGGKWQ